MSATIPVVNYLTLTPDGPKLTSTDCTGCEARYLGSRIACSRCGCRTFSPGTLSSSGSIGSFTIVHRAPRGVSVPFVSALVDLDDGFTVKANIVDCPPDTDHVHLGQRVELRTHDLGIDDHGTTAVTFGFTPVPTQEKTS